MIRFLSLLLSLSIFLVACEGKFVGEREDNLTVINGPYTMRIQEISGVSYLGLMNTNFRGGTRRGSLQFYSIANPQNPVLNEDLVVGVPTNAPDFYFDEPTSKLYVLNRNEDMLEVFELSGGSFAKQLKADGSPLRFELLRGPASILQFTSNQDGNRYLAISTQIEGSIQFFNLDTQEFYDASDLEELLGNLSGIEDLVYVGNANAVGARLEMIARDGSPLSGISSVERFGRGINELAWIGGKRDIIAAVSYTDSALFGFHFAPFDNSSNVLWNLEAFQVGYQENDERFPGTEEEGFRGLEIDGSLNIFLSSRSDNGLYKISHEFLAATRSGEGNFDDENTFAFALNQQRKRLPVDFNVDGDDKDNFFPRLSDLAINGTEQGQEANLAWVIGLESEDRGYPRSRLFTVANLNSDQVTLADSIRFPNESQPQKLLYSEQEGSKTLYVALTGSDGLHVYDVSSGAPELIRQLANP